MVEPDGTGFGAVEAPPHAGKSARIEARLGDAFSLMQAAETGQRGYLLTGLTSYLEPYETAVRELPEHFARLEAMLEWFEKYLK